MKHPAKANTHVPVNVHNHPDDKIHTPIPMTELDPEVPSYTNENMKKGPVEFYGEDRSTGNAG